MKKIKRSTLIPIVLLIYLAIMSVVGWNGYTSGQFTALYYFGSIGATLAIIVALHFFLKKRDMLRKQREEDMQNK